MSTLEEKKAAVAEAMKKIRSKAEKLGSDFRAGFGSEMEDSMRIEKIPIGIPEMDIMLGGGVSRARVTEIFGMYSVGKSTMAMHILEAFHKELQDDLVAFSPNEPSYDPEYRRKLGVTMDDRVCLNEADSLEDSLNYCADLADSKAVSCMVIDSIVGLGSRSERQTARGAEKDLDNQGIPPTPKTLSKFFRMTIGRIAKAKMALIVTNQIRTEGIGGTHTWDDVTAGHALKHYKGSSVKLRRIGGKDGPITGEDGKYIGFWTMAKLIKDKSGGIEGTEVKIPFIYGKGFKNTMGLISCAVTQEVVNKGGGGSFKWGDISAKGYWNFERKIIEGNLEDKLLKELYTKVGISFKQETPDDKRTVTKEDKKPARKRAKKEK